MTQMTSNEDYQREIQMIREIPIHKVLGMNNLGRRIAIKCPFHQDKTASCSIYPNNSYYCFGCSATGQNAIDFVVGLGYTPKEAIQELKKYI